MSDSDIPIDIAVRKLLDWLISRRICNRNWHDGVSSIREKIGEALGDMPEHEGIKVLLTGSNINYFQCLRIIEILKETEKESKNFFGSYGSQRMKDWQQIVKLYENDNIYLAEAASVISQNVCYEGPGLKKAITKCDTSEKECDKKEDNVKRRVTELQNEFAKECKDLGISGESSIKKEVIDLAKGLPETYEMIAEKCKILSTACDMYEKFVKKSLEQDCKEEIVGNLKFLIENGNVSTYEWKYKEKPVSIEETQLVFEDEEDNEQTSDEIDFGDDEIDFGGGDEIDFGDDNNEIDFGDGEIDFGVEGSENVDFGDVDVSNIVLEEGGISGGVARDEEALSILDNRRTRSLILDELEELSGFLHQRLAEKSSSGAKYSLVSNEDDSDASSIQKMVSSLESVIELLTESKMMQLQLIRGSPSVVNRLADRLKGILKMIEKVKYGYKEVENRRVQIGKDRIESTKQLAIVTEKTKDLKLEIEKDISKRYNGRPVNIMGCVW